MNVGLITVGNLEQFRKLLLPEAVSALENNVPLTTLGLSVKDTAIGALAGCLEGGCFEILSLYVDPEYRRRGGGQRLLDGLVGTLAGYARNVKIRIPAADQSEMEPFLTHCGFHGEDGTSPDLLAYVRDVNP